ncbi:dephospho-CoA kinase [Corynebacterium spheniscorum]|uniref:Dephospho-CoA kinase n=1 Tax=Corynebacterium spheniscorum TaxID=185761 RepID=A0A1I2SFB5_9CORY|nr:dephospho-CoA kinase [Corynebacterium spheniscorum]KAA8723927.1 dephospho-CoA kinase [Corynebacterium spheniscorum]SFG49587.1 dephospho-CoA kinase [Corynebacterium spheniscorum]
MRLIGLTGGIGSGKTTVARMLGDRGFHVIDADAIARDIVAPGSPALQELSEIFGSGILLPDGSLNRGELAARAFIDKEHTELLNSITHPRIHEETQKRIAAAPGDVVYDMPLLVDNDLHHDMDLVIVVDVDPETRVKRLAGRGIGEEDARRRIAAQIPDEVRRAAADIIIDNNGAPEDLIPQVEAAVAKINELP